MKLLRLLLSLLISNTTVTYLCIYGVVFSLSVLTDLVRKELWQQCHHAVASELLPQ